MSEAARDHGRGQETTSSRTRRESSAGGVVYRRNGVTRFLLIRDPYNNWGLPKGHIEEGETAMEAAEREVREETGLTHLRSVTELPTIDWYFRDQGQLVHKFCRFFLMESPSGDARPQLAEGISDCRWLPLDEALALLTHDNARQVLRAAGELLRAKPDL
ncbi:MAG TPA: NUDIX domain-containing protein [Longimicrobiales bacterium]|nr:NUDIX domain-containing protein [Longimicrobiales bacterium]